MDTLSVRLGGVLTPVESVPHDTGQAQPGPVDRAAPVSPIATELWTITMRVNEQAERAAALLRRLEV